MTHLVVLGDGWVGRAVARAAAPHMGVSVVDPPFDPVLRHRDGAARDALRELVRSTDAQAVVNACGRIHGSEAELADANVDFPRWVCESLQGLGVRLLHVGSASEYGDPGTARPVDEETPTRPRGRYAETKAAGTSEVLSARTGGMDAVVARVFNIVGSPVPAASPLHQWIDDLTGLAAGGGTIEVWWPETVRDFVRLDDVGTQLVRLAAPGERPGVVNVCSGTGLAYGDIVVALARRLGVSADVRSLERPGIPTVVGDPSRLIACTGSAPQMDLDLLARTAVPEVPSGR